MRHRFILFAFVAAASGCHFDQCTYETRFVGTSANVTNAQGDIRVDYVNFAQYRGSNAPTGGVAWQISAQNLTAPATALTIVSADGAVIATATVSSAGQTSMTSAGHLNVDDAMAGSVYDRLASGLSSVRLTLQDGTILQAPLQVGSRTDWYHPNCG